MTCRQNLILGLLVALSVSLGALPATHAADQSEQAGSLLSRLVPDIALRRGAATSTNQASSWQRSTRNRSEEQQESSAEIRFNKPVIAAASAPKTGAPMQEVNLAPRQPSPPAEPAPQISLLPKMTPTVIASDQDSDASGVRSITFARPSIAKESQAARATQASSLQAEKPERSVVTHAVASGQPQRLPPPASTNPPVPRSQPESAKPEPAPQQSTTSEARTGAQANSAEIELPLISRLLIDHQVKQAAEGEALPPSPMDAAAPGAGSSKGSKNGLEMADSDMYAGECCPPRPRLFWTAGVEATFLSPDLNSDGVSLEVEEIDEDRYDLCTTLSDDVDSVYVSPRIWLGVQGCDWGANLRYWHLQATEGSFDPSIGGQGDWDDFDCGRPDVGFMTSSGLDAYTIDLELTRRFCINECAMQAAFGVRHAEIEHNEALFGLANTDEGFLTGSARANRLSRGTGLQFGLYGRKPVFPHSCVHWFYNARWSALWGPTQTSVETFASVLTNGTSVPDGAAASVNGAYTNVDDTMFIGEIQLGLEWNYALRCLPANAFFRGAIEYQRWDGGMGFSQSQSFAGATIVGQVDPTSIITASAAAAEPQMDLVGISLGTGLTW
jgi:hypothetical protein